MPQDRTLIQGPFGSEIVPVGGVDGPAIGATDSADAGGRVPINDAVLQGTPGWGEARAQREANALRPDSTFLEGLGAAVSQWDTTRLLGRLARPRFDGETPINQFEYLQHIPEQLSEDEREYVLEVGRGDKSMDYALQQVRDRRMAAQVMGDHEVASFVGSFADPLWLAVPPSIRFGKMSPAAGRAIAATAGGALGAGVTYAGEGPVSDREIALSFAMNAGAAAVFYTPNKGLHKVDPDFPDTRLHEITSRAEAEAVPAGMTTVDAAAKAEAGASATIGNKLQWNMHKTMSGFGPVGKKIADLLLDNNSDLGLTSVESHREAILSELRGMQYRYEDILRTTMAESGYGTLKMINPFTSRKAHEAQAAIEKDVQRELFRREQLTREGLPIASEAVPKHITKMADALDALHKRALQELKASGVQGAEDIVERPGYLNRKWSAGHIEEVLNKLEAQGVDRSKGLAKVKSMVSLSLRRGGQLSRELGDTVSSAIVDRALRKGYFEDAAFNASSEAQLMELRDILREAKVDDAQVTDILNSLRVRNDTESKDGFLKHRMDLDYKASMRVGNENISVMDLIDSRVSSIVDQYISATATQSAFARKGVKSRTDMDKLRAELAHDLKPEQRKEAIDLYDNIIKHMRGEAAGASVNENFRLMQSYGRSISLAWSGLWQLTEFATAMAEYGAGKTLKYAMQEIPGFKQIMQSGPEDARSLRNVLADHSSQSMRLRPFISRYEDGYEMDMGNALQLSAQSLGQMVPYANAMKYVHHAQARTVGNLIVDRLERAAKGDQKAREALAQYGLEAPVMDKLADDIKAHGYNVDAWRTSTWDSVRPAFAKMMDASVLRGRLGDVPAFAAFDNVGKFLFTYRTFVLTAHNKVLAGNMVRNGSGAVGLVLLYQLPLTLAAVQAQATLTGEKIKDSGDLVKKAVGQMGGLGLFSEPFKWATGESNSVGAPGLIPVDRGVKVFSGALQGNADKAGSAAMTLMPVVSANPFWSSMAKQIKE